MWFTVPKPVALLARHGVSLECDRLNLVLLSAVTHQVNKPKQDDVAVIMYTSGSSGLPRGQLLPVAVV